MTQSIYDKFDAATRAFEAYALLRDGKPVGRIVIKFGNAATAYVQVWGAPMATGGATVYGYDKASSAVMAAICNMAEGPSEVDVSAWDAFGALRAVEANWRGGTDYCHALEAAGFTLAVVM